MRRTKTKLSVRRETLRNLSGGSLRGVRGGTGADLDIVDGGNDVPYPPTPRTGQSGPVEPDPPQAVPMYPHRRTW